MRALGGKLSISLARYRVEMASCAVQLIDKVTRRKVEKKKFETNILKDPCMKHPLQNRLYNNIQLPSKLSSGCDYSLFKDGIEPMWEDRSNKCGGRWLITLAKQHRHTELDRFWLETMLCLIGEGFGSFSRDICGSVINIRAKGDKIAIWTSNAENCETVTYIGQKYKESLGLPQKLVIGYQAHADTATKSNSITKNKFVV
ncbi:eukaryotic translation initiation factor 4E-1B isoform X3 [Megalobrama amblycephala]|uniref:eukaryotic translation initiation factor 4E-1B isoform X3 n=1 Tax=Megalobrama amblycephala TaxID=75352 RepID=UPI00201472CC|nr:eukaryotic translation initiation factor 4E-1B isoform X3 [Megalobrama amblycephala]